MKKSRVFLWLIVIAISITGVALHFMAPAMEGDLPHPLNGLFRELHGAASVFAIFMYGYFFSDHAQKKIAKRKSGWNRQIWDGYLHLSTWLLLIVSGLLLYYPQEILESVGVNIPAIHWYAGVLLIGLFPLHFWRKTFTRFQSRRRWENLNAAKASAKASQKSRE